ncbi:outer membrane beta-barrel protein [Oceanimonas marisflavi]|uniref:outer membrane beta-barrel protein n=1 Tax=Oceanimonas marisflavi TaxID=2059724 RepID=UPI000D3173DB|nr:outer membrane beta-barrel protein [Oceanimonas marisflavi]
MIKKVTALAILAASVTSLSANAETYHPGPYVGGSIGHTSVDWDVLDDLESEGASVDDNDVGYKLFAGYRINNFFAIEGFYADLGKATAAGSGLVGGNTAHASADVDASTFGLSALAIYPINDKVEVFGKVGFNAWDADANASLRIPANGINESASDSDDGTDPMYGVGAAYNIDNLSLRVEFERYELDDANVDMASAGISYKF